jgi:hypothetical protein
MTAAFRLWSKSTKVSEAHNTRRSSSRVNHLPGVFEQMHQDAEGLLAHLDGRTVATQLSIPRVGDH